MNALISRLFPLLTGGQSLATEILITLVPPRYPLRGFFHRTDATSWQTGRISPGSPRRSTAD